MKLIKTPNNELINTNYIVSIQPTKTREGNFDFKIDLITGSGFNIGDYLIEEQRDEELNKLKDFLIDDSSKFYYYIDNDESREFKEENN
jgi:hypothetical protein